MEILQNLLSFFLKNSGASAFQPIFDLLKTYSFNIGEALKHLTPETIAPIVKEFMKNTNGQNKNPTDFSVGNPHGLNPIANVADKEIIYALNRHFSTV
jgi:hypothetical protein